MIDYVSSLHSAKRLEDEYRASRQSVGLANLEGIQKDVARALLAAILESKESVFEVRAKCEEIGGFLSAELLSLISASTR